MPYGQIWNDHTAFYSAGFILSIRKIIIKLSKGTQVITILEVSQSLCKPPN